MIKYYKSSVKHLWTSKDSIITMQSLWYFYKLILLENDVMFYMLFLWYFCILYVFLHTRWLFLQMNTLSYRVVLCHMGLVIHYYLVPNALLTAETWTGQVYTSFSMIGKTLISSKKDQKMSDIIFSKLNDFIVKIWKNMTSKWAFHMIGCKC